MRHQRALQLADRIRSGCPEARVLVVGSRAGTAAVFVSLAGRTVRIDRLSDWRGHFRRDLTSRGWSAVRVAPDPVA